MKRNVIHTGDAFDVLNSLPESSVHMAMTSPPFFALRDYGVKGQLGQEESPDEYVRKIADVVDKIARVLKDDGSLWLNIGDSYASKPAGNADESSDSLKGNYQENSKSGTFDKSKHAPEKSKLLIPQKVAIELQERKYTIRNDIVWYKPDKGIPESVTDRHTRAYEMLLHIPMSNDYNFDLNRIREPNGSIPPDVWTIKSNSDSTVKTNFARYPPKLCETPIKATCPDDGIVLDPFAGSGTTLAKAKEMGRDFIGVELNPEYADMARANVGLSPNNPSNLRSHDDQSGLEAYADGGEP